MRSIRTMLWRRSLLLPGIAVLSSLAFAGVASAATYNVNDTRDYPQSTTASPGSCVSTASTCTLRAAVQAANESGGSNTINVPAGTYNLTASSSNGTDTCTHATYPGATQADESYGSLKVDSCNNSTSITITGTGSGATVINGQNNYRIFDLFPNGSLDLQKMTLENGNGLGVNDTSDTNTYLSTGDGGAIDSDGHLSLESVTFTGNSPGTVSTYGGAVAAEDSSGSTIVASGDVFQNNNAAYGGAVATYAPNDVTIAFSLLQANNSTKDGGAIYGGDTAAGLTLNFDDLVQNVAAGSGSPYGGGGLAWLGNGPVTITNSLFNQNQATNGYGGGALDYSPTGSAFNVSNTSFDGNTAHVEGGGLSDGVEDTNGSNALSLTQDKFTNNQAGTDAGGAVAVESENYPTSSGVFTGGATIVSSEFDGNSMTSNGEGGGALEWVEGNLTIIGSSFVLNSSPGLGGAIFDERSTTPVAVLTLVDSTLSRNTAGAAGGAIASDTGGNATMMNDTIAFNNAAAGEGGGIAVSPSGTYTSGGSAASGFGIENTTIAENSGGDCATGAGLTASKTFTSAFDTGNNNDSDQTCFGGLGGPNDKTGVNPLLSNPANNGGPAAGGPGDTEIVQTDAESSSSPTVDAGNNNGCPKVDERGVARPQGKACDIGAFEFGASPTTVTSTTTTVKSTSTTTSRTVVTTTTTTHHPGKKPAKKCGKGKHKSHGKCVKNKKPKKHKKHHKKK